MTDRTSLTNQTFSVQKRILDKREYLEAYKMKENRDIHMAKDIIKGLIEESKIIKF